MARNFNNGALRLINATSSTGVSEVFHITPVVTASIQVTGTSGATGTVLLQGSLDGNLFAPAIAATTFITSTAGGVATIMTSTSTHLYTQLQANLTVTGTTEKISVYVTGK